MNLAIKTAKLVTSKTGKQYIVVTDMANEVYSDWDIKHFDRLKEGTIVDVEVVHKGDFKNITAVNTTAIEPPKQTDASVWDKKDRMNSRQTALNCASTYWAAMIGQKATCEAADILRLAEVFYKYVYYGNEKVDAEEIENNILDQPF